MSSYPTITGSVIVSQYPYVERDQWLIAESSTPSGKSYTRPYTSGVRRQFTLNYQLIQRADVKVIEGFFDSMRGRLGEFSFTDDQGVTWTHTRFDQDELDIVYNDANSYALTVALSAEGN